MLHFREMQETKMQFFQTITLGKPLNRQTKFQLDSSPRFAMNNLNLQNKIL